jgi:hypothetical protein
MRKTMTVPARIAARPDPADWGDDDLLTIPEAAALFWPAGPLTDSSLRTAIRQRRLAVSVIAGKHFVTPAAIRQMARPEVRAGPAPEPPPAAAGPNAADLLQRLREDRQRLRRQPSPLGPARQAN